MKKKRETRARKRAAGTAQDEAVPSQSPIVEALLERRVEE
jgi:hypothetical protein